MLEFILSLITGILAPVMNLTSFIYSSFLIKTNLQISYILRTCRLFRLDFSLSWQEGQGLTDQWTELSPVIHILLFWGWKHAKYGIPGTVSFYFRDMLSLSWCDVENFYDFILEPSGSLLSTRLDHSTLIFRAFPLLSRSTLLHLSKHLFFIILSRIFDSQLQP